MIVPFLCFHGQCEEAVTFYAKVFGFEARFLLFHQAPGRGFDVPESFNSKVMFTQFTIADQQVMATDHIPGLSTTPGQSVTLNIIHPSKADIERWFAELSVEGTVGMPLQKTGWAPWYGSLTDRYGITWQFSLNA